MQLDQDRRYIVIETEKADIDQSLRLLVDGEDLYRPGYTSWKYYLNAGVNVFVIEVTSADKRYKENYTIKVTRGDPNKAHTVTVVDGTTSLKRVFEGEGVHLTPEDRSARGEQFFKWKFEGLGDIKSSRDAKKTITIKDTDVKATATYMTDKTNPYLKDIKVGSKESSGINWDYYDYIPKFSTLENSYEVTLVNNSADVVVLMECPDSNQNIEVTCGNEKLEVKDVEGGKSFTSSIGEYITKKFIIKVKAAEGDEGYTYYLKVRRCPVEITPETINVGFRSGEGSGIMYDSSAPKNSTFKAPPCKFKAPKNKEFDKWSYKLGEQTLYAKEGDEIRTTDQHLVLTAIWKLVANPEPEIPRTEFDTFANSNGGFKWFKCKTADGKDKKITPGTKVKVSYKLYDTSELDKIIVFNEKNETFDLVNDEFIMPACDVTVRFLSKAKNFKIKYTESEFGTFEESQKTATYYSGVSVKVNAKPGYEIDKITVKASNGENVSLTGDSSFLMPACDVTVTASFKKIIYEVKYINKEDNQTIKSQKATVDDEVTLKYDIPRGYKVNTLTLSPENEDDREKYSISVIDGKFKMPPCDVRIEIEFVQVETDTEDEVETVKVTFVKNGHGASPSTVVQYVAKNSEVPGIDGMNDTKYDFVGWYTDSQCTNKFIGNITEPITLYAKWELKPNESEDDHGNTGSGDEDHGDNDEDHGNDPDPGHQDPDPNPDPEHPTPTPNPNPNPITVSFNMMGRGNQVPAQTVKENAKAFKPQDPSAAGYTFGGWFTESTLTNKFDFNTPITRAITLYAKWTKNADTPINPPTPRPTEKGYRIFFDRLYNGDAWTLTRTAEEGEWVRIFTRPDPGYEVYSIVVRDARQRIISIDSETFVMPDSYVSIDVTFRDIYSYRPSYRDDERVYRPQREERKVERKAEAKEVKKESKKFVALKAILTEGSSDLVQYIGDIKNVVKMNIAPYIKNGRTMLSVRYVSEALGFNVEWNHASRTVIIKDKENRVEIPVDTNKIIVNGLATLSDVKPEMRNNRTMLPIANIGRALGLEDGKDIFWNPITKSASITRNIEVK
ncbi:stalk domain-containing protein [Fenollaria sporofastidiosus]|uniref:stalk domain-containing protein n=1 Tax=Fenollaria sporofastidiosus TaxID=2811778 RepID=UPI001C004297|nr:InlB B-repeat-containing protein [Fenollaria sporofastidiosus]